MTMEINKEEIKELRELYQACLEEAKTIGRDVLGETLKQNYALRVEDYRQIATSLFIEYNYRHGRNKGKGDKGGGQGQGKYSGPSTEKQQKHIATMAMQGAKNETIITEFLKANQRTSAEELTKSEASTLIDMLHGANPRR